MAAVQTAYLLKESFDQRWGHSREGWARRFFDNSLGFVEGVNAKIRVIQRRAYGLRDEEYARRWFIEAGLLYSFYVDEWLKPPP